MFYTIRYEDQFGTPDEENETDKFLEKIDTEEYAEVAGIFTNLISQIGTRGAAKRYFRFENSSNALPPKRHALNELDVSENEYNFRLYCIRLSD